MTALAGLTGLPALLRASRVAPAASDRQQTAEVAETVLRVAVLLEAGVSPPRAWEHLAALGDPRGEAVHRAVRRGLSIERALAALAAPEPPPPRRGLMRLRGPRARIGVPPSGARAWRDVAAAWAIATEVGAPLASTLRGFAEVLRDAGEAADEIRIALAEPTATARLMGWLPAVGIALAIVLGFDPLGTLLREPAGWACAAGGIALLVSARRWTARLTAAAHRDTAVPGMEADLTAIALRGGVSIARARELVDRSASIPAPEDAAGGASGAGGAAPIGDSASIRQTLELSQAAGVPAVELLRSAAALERHRARVEGRLRAARLSSRLLLPLGVCTLPAFLCLGVAPMFLSILPSVAVPLP